MTICGVSAVWVAYSSHIAMFLPSGSQMSLIAKRVDEKVTLIAEASQSTLTSVAQIAQTASIAMTSLSKEIPTKKYSDLTEPFNATAIS